jgi:DNA-binding NtrC family response regulator
VADVDGDGDDQYVVGAPNLATSPGHAYFLTEVSGGTGDADGLGAEWEGEAASDQAGISVDDAGDIDGDGAAEPFVAVNCGAIPDELAESVLFGHERGAFTGADRRREGLVERTGRGTLFLDEVGEAPARRQVKLLRLLQEGVFERLGGTEELPFRGRVVAATWRPLTAPDSSFRNDLFHRLAAGVLRVPPLRERREDIPALAEHLLARALAELPDSPPLTIGQPAIAELGAREWPGNVRELDNALKAAIARALAWGGDAIGPQRLDEGGSAPAAEAEASATGLLAATEAFQRSHVRRALEEADGNRSVAADRLGVTRQWLHRLLAR